MTDFYTSLAQNPLGRKLVTQVGLPAPVALQRHNPGDPVVEGEVLLGAAPGGRLTPAIAKVLAGAGAKAATEMRDDLRAAAADAGLDASIFNSEVPGGREFKALVFDATGIHDSTQLRELRAFFQPTVGRVEPSGRIVVLGTPPAETENPRAHTAQRALEGFTRALGKEAGRGIAVNLVHVSPGAEDDIASTLRFLLSPRSAYVSGQVVRVGTAVDTIAGVDWEQPLAGRTALVTGASRGIGAAIAGVLARDGAHVVGLDIPALGDDLKAVTEAIGGEALELDITSDEAPATISQRFGKDGLHVLVHNAGITRDRRLARMDEDRWDAVLNVNLSSEERITDRLLDDDVLAEGGRIVCVSSISGIAGNTGQTNYATSKAGVIGFVHSHAPLVAQGGVTINAVAPGFIETQMTAKVPLPIREAGRRMNSMSQGGLPVDVAEAIAWFAGAGSGGLNGNVVRVCGQSLLGA